MNAPQHLGEVLVVEDNPASLKLLADLLDRAGYAVRQAPDGELALWSAGASPPELVLLDVRMPGIDGFEVCRRLKQAPALRDIPVIFLSAQSDTGDKVEGFKVGAIDFIGKPYQAEEVLARTAAHIALARSQRALAAANAELRATRDDLRRSERLAALGAMVAGVAHELNTPIGNSLLAAGTLEQRTEAFAAAAGAPGLRRPVLDAFVADALQASVLLQRNLAACARLVDNFKQVATGPEALVRSDFELGPLLAESLRPFAPRLEAAGVALQLRAAPGIAMRSYPAAIEQLLGQLAHNALLHAFAGRGGTLCVTASSDGGSLILSVSDDGAGIAEASLRRVFEPFFTTRMGQGSNGLGLYIAHNLAQNVLGGLLEVSSIAARTTFVLRCPCSAPSPSHPATATAP